MARISRRRAYVVRTMLECEFLGDGNYLAALADSRYVPPRLKHVSEHSEYNRGRIREKLSAIQVNTGNRLYRCNFWLDIARLERIRGNDVMAVTYELRFLRLIGRDVLGILPRVA